MGVFEVGDDCLDGRAAFAVLLVSHARIGAAVLLFTWYDDLLLAETMAAVAFVYNEASELFAAEALGLL